MKCEMCKQGIKLTGDCKCTEKELEEFYEKLKEIDKWKWNKELKEQ